ncbi:Uncharacterised protein [Klebsiella pneumoniae]|nr:Uncharacterised protein [Klebsiella pneumoniae]
MPPVLSRNKQNTPRQAPPVCFARAAHPVQFRHFRCPFVRATRGLRFLESYEYTILWQILAALASGKKGPYRHAARGAGDPGARSGHEFAGQRGYRERQIRQLEEDAQWVTERLERRMNIPAPQREATWPLAAMRAALQTLARERHYQLLLVNGDGHLLAASHALPASVLAQVQAQFPREMQPPLFGSHYQTIQPFAPHQRMLSRALNGNAGLAGWNLVMLAPDGGLPSLLVAYRWPVTIGLGAVLASALLALRQAARARRKR